MNTALKLRTSLVAFAISNCLACTEAPMTSEELDLAQNEEELAATSSSFWSPVYGGTMSYIHFCYDSSVSSTRRTTIEEHAKVWETLSASQGVEFVFDGTCPASIPAKTIPIVYDSSAPNSRVVGVGTACTKVIFNATGKYEVVHEFGHVLGFKHEHARNDSTCTEDPAGTIPDLGLTSYDDDSVMNYCGPNDGNLTSRDKSGFAGVYGGATIPTNGGVIALRNALDPTYFYAGYGKSGQYTGLLANVASINDGAKFTITKYSGAESDVVENGDVVYIKNNQKNQYLTVNPDETIVLSSSKTANARFTVRRRIVSGGTVKANEEVSFKGSNGKYITLGISSPFFIPILKASASTTGSYANWRIVSMSAGLNTL